MDNKNDKKYLLAAGVLGLAVVALIIYGIEYRKSKKRDKKEIITKLKQPKNRFFQKINQKIIQFFKSI